MSEFSPDAIHARLIEVGEEWADRKAAYEALDDLTKTVYADVVTDYLPTCKTKSEAELRGYTDKVFKAHLAEKAGARRAWLQAEVKWKTGMLWAELRRSLESTKRAEMGMR